jgi:hypothetical protein
MNRGAKCFYISIIFILFSQVCYSQTDIVTLSRVKDFINAGLTHIIISSASISKDTVGKNLEINAAFQRNTLENPVYFAAVKKLLEGKFDSVTKKFSERVDLIDINKYVHLDEQKAAQALYDTAFSLLRQQYPAILTLAVKDSVYLSLMEKGKSERKDSVSISKDTIQKTAINKSPATPHVPWYGRFQGFVFWLLACVFISVSLFLYCLDQIRQLKIKLGDAEKSIVHLQDEKETGNQQGPVTTVYTEFRNLVTLKIKELYDIIDHLNLRIVALEKKNPPETTLIDTPTLLDDSVDNEEIFYMSTPLDGHFPFTARSLKKDALYKFTITNSKTEANYEVINDGLPIAEVLQDMPRFLDPACISESEPQGEVRVIITKIPGIAQFDGEKWAIQQKASIVFI